MAVTMALWNPDPDEWYYDQEASGGMPLTHMSYCYLNAVRWILGQANHRVRDGQSAAQYGSRSRSGRDMRGPDRI